MEIIKKCFGKQLRICRKLKNLTQEKLAEMVGINLRQLARIESGESFVTAETLHNFCKILEISPKQLFDFDIEDEFLMTAYNNNESLKVIKSKNGIQFVNSNIIENKTNDIGDIDFQNRILRIARNINKNIIVEELKKDSVYQTKIYKPDGNIEIATGCDEEENYNKLVNDIDNIKNDKNKINYMSLAYNSLSDKQALDELKSMIKGIELTLD